MKGKQAGCLPFVKTLQKPITIKRSQIAPNSNDAECRLLYCSLAFYYSHFIPVIILNTFRSLSVDMARFFFCLFPFFIEIVTTYTFVDFTLHFEWPICAADRCALDVARSARNLRTKSSRN